MKKLLSFLLVTGVLLSSGCTKPVESERVLKQNGYKDVEITGYKMFSCSDKDTFSTGFKATSVNGSKVSGTVCSGLFKGNTIRLD